MVKYILKYYLLIICLVLAFIVLLYQPWSKPQRNPIKSDVAGYYIYLPAIFIYQDIQFSFLDEHPEIPENGAIGTGYYKTENGYVSKYPPGLAIMYMPFFVIAYLWTLIFGGVNDGYSTPYLIAMVLHPIVYLWIGLYYLSKLMQLFFNIKWVRFSILILVLSTNLFFYTLFYGNMPHLYLFVINIMVVWYAIEWERDTKYRSMYNMILLLGLSLIIRPSNIIIALFPLIWNFSQIKDLLFSFNKFKYLLTALVLFFIFPMMMFVYWKLSTGEFIYYSYKDEGFDFLHPHIFEVLIGFRKGWLIYTPIMFFALIGMFFFKPYNLNRLVILLLFVHVLIISSWWCWWYGGCFGMRPMVDIYGLLWLPFTALLCYIFEAKNLFVKFLFSIILLFCAGLNLFQTVQYLKGVLHYDNNNYASYKYIWGKLSLSENEKKELEKVTYNSFE